MKIKSLALALVVVAVAFSLAACGCFEQKMRGEAAPPVAPEQKTVVAPEQKPEMAVKEKAAAAIGTAGLEDVFFDFDKYNIRSGDAETLKKDYAWMQGKSGKLKIEGNCDERGTVEYNLILGQKRADAAKAYLVNLGVDANRLETISYGKEKPIDPGHNEAAWAKNRRDHFTPIQ